MSNTGEISMKRFLFLLTTMIIAALLAGCGNSSQKSSVPLSQQSSVADVLQQGMAEADKKDAPTQPDSAPVIIPTATTVPPTPEMSAESISKLASNTEEGIDVDLTKLSSTMIYAEVYAMMSNPKDYIGKTIRMRGDSSAFYDKYSGNYYFACLIRDATACCAQGIEFVLNENYKVPEDYPKTGEEITVTGVFDSYMEDKFTFYHLKDAVLSD